MLAIFSMSWMLKLVFAFLPKSVVNVVPSSFAAWVHNWREVLKDWSVDNNSYKELFLLAQMGEKGADEANAVIGKLIKKRSDKAIFNNVSAWPHRTQLSLMPREGQLSAMKTMFWNACAQEAMHHFCETWCTCDHDAIVDMLLRSQKKKIKE